MGPDVRFPHVRTHVAKKALWAPRVLSEGPSAPSVAPLAPFRDFWGSLGPPVSPLGAPRGLPKTASKIQNRFWEGPWGRQCTFNLGKNAFREKTNKNDEKKRSFRNVVRRSFSQASKIAILAPRRAPEARFKILIGEKGASKSRNCRFALGQTTFREKRPESLKNALFGPKGVLRSRFKKSKWLQGPSKNRQGAEKVLRHRSTPVSYTHLRAHETDS